MTNEEQEIVDILMRDILGGVAIQHSDFMESMKINSIGGKVSNIATILAVTDYYQNLTDGNVN